LLDLGLATSVVERSGSWFIYKNERLGQGRENAKAFLRENPKVLSEIEKKIQDKVASGASIPAAARS